MTDPRGAGFPASPTALDASRGWSAADRYDQWFDTGWGAYAFSIEARALTRATRRIETRLLLDVGCGSGRFTRELETSDATLVGLDREPAMLAVARRRVPAPFVVADALALPLRDHCADVTLAVTVLEFVADPNAAIAELARVTRTGGRIVVGALNPQSAWGWAHRHEFSQPPWRDARFLSRGELRALARPYGPARVRGVLHAPRAFPGLRIIGPIVETLGRAVPSLGAFQVLVIDKR